jgi:hypothetical protein
VDWSPFSANDVSAACRVVQADNAANRRLGRPCRRHRQCGACLRNGCGSCETKADAPVEPIVQSVCGVGAPSDAWDAIARAHCIVDQTGAACCDGNIRAFYAIDTSLAMQTSHGDLTGWSIYDHRRRDWYLRAARRWEETGTPTAWSSIYSCYESGKYCITATAVASRLDGSGRSRLIGIFAADYELDVLRSIIKQGTDGIEGTWAYLVEGAIGLLHQAWTTQSTVWQTRRQVALSVKVLRCSKPLDGRGGTTLLANLETPAGKPTLPSSRGCTD